MHYDTHYDTQDVYYPRPRPQAKAAFIGWLKVCAIIALFFIVGLAFASMVGCQSISKVPNTIPAVGTSIDRAGAHVGSAENAVQAAKPYADKTGKALLGLATKEHGAASKELTAAKVELGAVTKERNTLVNQVSSLAASNAALTHSWGHRLQVYVTAAFWIIVSLIALHFILGALAIFLPPPYGTIAGLISRIVNPFGWFTWLVTHALHNAAAKAATPILAIPG